MTLEHCHNSQDKKTSARLLQLCGDTAVASMWPLWRDITANVLIDYKYFAKWSLVGYAQKELRQSLNRVRIFIDCPTAIQFFSTQDKGNNNTSIRMYNMYGRVA